MKKLLILIFIAVTVKGQWEISGGMGVSLNNFKELKDYTEVLSSVPEKMNSFESSAEFFIQPGYNLNENYQIAVDFGYNLYSFNSGNYELTIKNLKPTVFLFYQLPGEGYKLKFGAGLGYRTASIDEKIADILGTESFLCNGIGLKLKLEGDTKLGTNLYAKISGSLGYDIMGEIEPDEAKNSPLINKKINLNTFSLMLGLGISYYF